MIQNNIKKGPTFATNPYHTDPGRTAINRHTYGICCPTTTPEQNLEILSRKGIRCIVAGNFNAQVGLREDHDDDGTVGPHGHQQRNSRSDRLVQWSALNRLGLGKTFFDHQDTGAWTYRNNRLFLQNDDMLFDKHFSRMAHCCVVCPDMDTGSDHRAILACILQKKNLET